MAILTGFTVASTYKDLMVVSGGGSGVTSSLATITDGAGTLLPYKISTTKFQFNNTAVSILGTDAIYALSIVPGSALTAPRVLTITTGDSDRTLTLDTNFTASDALTGSSTSTLTNKSISLTTNTLTGSLAEFNTALSGADFVSLAGSETLTNKTLTSPTLTGPILGTPVSGNLTNCTFPTLNQDTSGTAAIATTVTATATGTNASFFPTFVASSITGNQSISIDAGISYNPSTNALTATTFIGALTGNASTATTVTTNANLTGPVTSVGNATTIAAGVVTEAMQVLADNTTQDVSTSKHGYAPKAPNDSTKFLNGVGGYTVPAGTGMAAATQAEQEAASSTSVGVTPGRQQFHPSSAKAWGNVFYSTGTPTLNGSYNIASLTDTGTGDYRANYTVAMSSANYVALAGPVAYAKGNNLATPTASYVEVTVYSDAAIDTLVDNGSVFVCYGDQ